MRSALVVILIIGAVVGLSWLGYQQFGGAKAAAGPDYDVIPVSRGDITSVVSASGTVLPERQTNLTFQSGGTITSVPVQVGDQVKIGQVLAQLDAKDLELAIRQAQIGVRQAEAQLAQLKVGPNAVDVASAKAALASAQAAYQQVLNGTDADRLAAARAQVEQARVVLEQAQQQFDKVKDVPGVGMLPQSLQLQQATIGYETAQANYRVSSRGADQAQLAASQAQIAQAQAALDRVQRGPTKEQVDVAQAAVDQAQLAVEQAQRRLENTRLVAPWSGIVTSVAAVEGALAQPGIPALQLTDQSQFHINVQVDEVDVASVAPDQAVNIELDALPGQKFAGHVHKIAPAATVDQAGTTSYVVTVHFDRTDTPVRAGMSATANITSNSRKDVLLAPNRAVQIDRESGRTYIEKETDLGPQKVEVRLGLRDEQHSEVREGLAENDRVIIRKTNSLEQLQKAFGQNN
ncbi:MAG: efflux RND transporter periplasmic adaptor subunit [Anaerolineae bacterium]|jgi:HlyD family secretion protein|nr:efflux RND transporter periplasmic adaptor subunit [Anaerolineae bacterium]